MYHLGNPWTGSGAPTAARPAAWAKARLAGSAMHSTTAREIHHFNALIRVFSMSVCRLWLEATGQQHRSVRIRYPDGADGAHRIQPRRKLRAVGVTQFQRRDSGKERDHPCRLTVREYEQRGAVRHVDIDFHREGLLRVAGHDLCASNTVDRLAL